MDIETLRRASAALAEFDDIERRLNAARSDLLAAERNVDYLEDRHAKCKAAIAGFRIAEGEPPRTLESEGQKWDEEARRKVWWYKNVQGAQTDSEEHHGC